jgi:small-conductance mechanosensitive channel
MKISASLLLAVGCLWALFVVWLFLTIAGIAEAPKSVMMTALYWFGMSIGPLTLILGAMLSLKGTSLRSGAILVGIGCAVLTGFVLYHSIIGIQREPLQAPPPYLFYLALLLIMLLSDAAAYKVYRALSTEPANSQNVSGK